MPEGDGGEGQRQWGRAERVPDCPRPPVSERSGELGRKIYRWGGGRERGGRG